MIRSHRARYIVFALAGMLAASACSRQTREGVAETADGAAVVFPIDAARVAPPTSVALAPADPFETTIATARNEVEYIDAYDAPNGNRLNLAWSVVNPTYFGGPATFVVTGGRSNDDWVKVLLPVRPNHTTGWVRTRDFTFTSTRYRILISLEERTLRVFEADNLFVETPVVIGKGTTPTPLGRFAINERVQKSNSSGPYGPWILGVSAFSETLETFDGGVPVIGLHGTNQPFLLGQAASNGCVRMPNEVVDQLARTLPLGTPVEITA